MMGRDELRGGVIYRRCEEETASEIPGAYDRDENKQDYQDDGELEQGLLDTPTSAEGAFCRAE